MKRSYFWINDQHLKFFKLSFYLQSDKRQDDGQTIIKLTNDVEMAAKVTKLNNDIIKNNVFIDKLTSDLAEAKNYIARLIVTEGASSGNFIFN